MSDVSTNVNNTQSVIQTVLETLNSGWGYSIGGIILVVAAGYWGYKKINKPKFVIAQIRRRNMKEMKKMGAESNDAMVDLDRLLDSVEAYATKQGMTGSAMTKLLAPLQQNGGAKTAGTFYHSMIHIAKNIGDNNLANTLLKKSKQVKSSSALMAGLLKRAGV
ncbi:hypothetical protein OAP63_08875 [Vibrio sp.]|uniref:Uncharacterized protein n=1 Tax=Vibrio viridaestus TaxID=2487322 RepID=A0A3N9TES4_9VIBR|nr:hypothetical protein [Vibrio viridaestus]MDC0610836.1 hypothetical protein [Vibrio sp.]RQW62619.1 hypothetical protein EES38_12905 [Vibrio viridaestus]